MTLTERLSSFALDDCQNDAALRMMRLSLLDWAACGCAAVAEPAAVLTRQMVESDAGTPEASVLGGAWLPARSAALVNGVTSHALDYDDTHFAHIGHPSVAVIPAALAVAERTGASGEAFLQACLAGVEASIRIGVWLGRGHYQIGYHQTGTAGCFGATIAAGRLLGCDAGQLGHAIGLASTRAAGLKSQFGTMGKPYNAGAAAAAGVEVALLAEAGFVSNPDAISGPLGFGETHHGAEHAEAFEGLGQRWLFEQISHKFHACCHGTHAMIEALRSLECSDVAEIVVRTHPRWLSVCDKPNPTTGLEAKFSYRFIAAMVLLGHDTARPDSFSDALVREPVLCALRDKVRVAGDESLPETATHVTVRAAGGKTWTAEHDIADPLAVPLREAKLRKKVEALLSQDAAELIQAVLGGTQVDLAALGTCLRHSLSESGV
ncbi:MAG: MmgE/PrpD family protein [Pseudomonadota bacterium]